MKRSTFLRLSSAGVLGAATRGTLACFCVERIAAQEGSGPQPRPYLHMLRTDSVWVSWWTDQGGSARVEWGDSDGHLPHAATGTVTPMSAANHYHLVKITGLQPGRPYHYRVSDGQNTSATFRFRTPPAPATQTGRFRVLVIGDNQILSNERRWERMIQRAKTKLEETYSAPLEDAVDLILNVGDQVDVGTIHHWRNLHFEYSAPVSARLAIMTTVGNHETYQDPGLAHYKTLFRYDESTYQGITSPDPRVYYAHQQSRILFLHLSSEHTGATQAAWVQAVITAAAADPSVDFIISLCHRPYQAEQFIGDISNWLRNTIMPILCQTEKHVLTIGAHHHLYARGQARQWPCYHIISGASAWDQFWGQSTEADYDDVQKTIAHWAWQVLDFDLAAKRMQVDCYSEANVRFPENTRWTSQAYLSRKIDSFHRQPGLAAPATPTLTPPESPTLTLPATLRSGPFSSPAGEILNSTWFQLAKDPAFTQGVIDRIRDVENLFGDSGAPAFEPVDRHAGVDILEWSIPANGIPNGTYHLRVRHRDANASWSEWSPSLSFTIEGSIAGDPALQLAKRVYNDATHESIQVQFEFAPGNTTDWIGIYRKGQAPGGPASTQWAYLNGTRSAPAAAIANGVLTFPASALTAGNREWFVAFFASDSYTEVAPRVPFFVGSTPRLAASREAYDPGETVRIDFQSAPATATAPRNQDWIGLYRVGQSPGPTPSAAWSYVNSASGFREFANLPKGYYYATYLVNDGYFEISERVLFSVGTEISSVVMPRTQLAHGDDFDVVFSDGPGTPKDYLGIFRQGEEPGEGDLVAYLYVGGKSAGTLRFVEDLEPGNYYLALFLNDSYTAVSNRVDFTIRPKPDHSLRDISLDDGNLRMAFSSESGVNYRLWKSTSLRDGDWILARDIAGNGARIEVLEPVEPLLTRCFYRLERVP